MNFIKFFNETINKHSEPIKHGDLCRNKYSGVYSYCLNVDRGLFYGKTKDNQFTMGKVEDFEKVER